MSRIGKQPVAVPAGVEVAVKDDLINVKGTLRVLALAQNALVKVENKAGTLSFTPVNDSREANAMSGTMRQLVNNMVNGVSKGFEKKLSLIGVGYKAQAQGVKLNLSVGYSHPVVFNVPKGLTATIPADSKGTVLVLNGADKELIGQTAATIRGFRPPEPYGGKGVRYRGERVREKAGKAGGKGGKK